ncbi:MAG: zinc ribbon domain-containing protein [Chitinispirillaceae bacterium]|nr:zinc ribbon domain-containing protein [Chitinispirillaceae bacterium]
MPIYEYRCEKCAKIFEEIVNGDRDKAIPCPTCGFEKTTKLMSRIGGISVNVSSSSCPSTGAPCSTAPRCSAMGGGCCCG